MTNEELLQLIIQQNQQILDRLDCYATKDELNAVKSDVVSHGLFINGNGQRGAKSRLDLLEEKVTTVLDKLEDTVKKIAQQTIQKMVIKFLIGVAITFGVPLILWASNVIYQASKSQP